MPEETIIIEIDGDKVGIEVGDEIQDSSCHDLTQRLEEAIGTVISKDEKTCQERQVSRKIHSKS